MLLEPVENSGFAIISTGNTQLIYAATEMTKNEIMCRCEVIDEARKKRGKHRS